MKLIFEAAQEVQSFFDSNNWKFCFIGGVALQRWAVPRLTNDVDLTLLTGFDDEGPYLKRILERFEPRIESAEEFALRNRVLLVAAGNVGVDISLGGFSFEESAVSRATMWDLAPDINLRTCSAEDLVVFKAFADRLQDWADVESLLSVQAELDWRYILEHLEPLVELKESPEIMTKLHNLRTSSK